MNKTSKYIFAILLIALITSSIFNIYLGQRNEVITESFRKQSYQVKASQKIINYQFIIITELAHKYPKEFNRIIEKNLPLVKQYIFDSRKIN